MLSSPHQNSHMALLDDNITGFLSRIKEVVPKLSDDVSSHVINMLKTRVDEYMGTAGDEIERRNSLFLAVEAQEPIREGVRCISVGGT